MRGKIQNNIGAFILLCIELFTLYTYRKIIIDLFAFFTQTSQNNYDDIFVSIIASVALSVLQVFNLLVVEFLISFSKRMRLNFFQRIFQCPDLLIHNCIQQMMAFIFSVEHKWGATRYSSVVKNANRAEGLLACAYSADAGYHFTNNQKREIDSIIGELLKELCVNGYKSYNEDTYTVHCTGMVLFSIKRLVDLELYEITDEDEEKIRACLKNLLKTANAHGWGFKNVNYNDTRYNRALSTIWALRALNAWGYSSHKIFRMVLGNLVDHSDGVIGFAIGSTAKSASTAMLYILSTEVKSKKTKDLLAKQLNKEEILHALLKGLKTEIEVEEYVISIPENKKLSWTHLCECIVIEALALCVNDMNTFQIFQLTRYLGEIINKIDMNHHYYVVDSMNFNHEDPFLYPTAYLVYALSNILKQKGIDRE